MIANYEIIPDTLIRMCVAYTWKVNNQAVRIL